MSQLVEVLYDSKFDLSTFKKILKYLKDCEEVSTDSKKESINDHGFQTGLMKDGEVKNKDRSTFYVKHGSEVLQEPVELLGKEDIKFHTESKERMSEVIYLSMTTPFMNRSYIEVRKWVMG